jgi:hypothetical protein
MSILDNIKWLISWKKYDLGIRVFIYYDEDWRLLLDEIAMSGDPKTDTQLLKKLWIYKIVKAINVRQIWEMISKFKINNAFLLHFFEIMEQQEEKVGDKVIFKIKDIFERLQKQDVKYFEFYRYIYMELNRWKKLWEIIRTIKWFENYVEFFDMLESLKEEDRAKLFWKLKEKILKEENIKKQILWPLKQPIIMIIIILSIFVWFSWSMIKDIMSQFIYLWYDDRIPWIISFIYNLWTFIKQNLLLILFYIATFLMLFIGLMNIPFIKKFFHRLLFLVPFYKYFNELFIAYVLLLQNNNEKKSLVEVFNDLKESYKDNIYYYFVFDLIHHNVAIAAEKYVPLRKYWYILSEEFITSLEQIIKQKKLVLINSYIRFVDWKIDQILKKFSSVLWTLWMLVVAGGILVLFLWIFLWNNAKSELIKLEAKWDVFAPDVQYNIVDPKNINNILEFKNNE